MRNIETRSEEDRQHAESSEDLITRLSEVEGVSEDAATFIAHNWRKLLLLMGLSMFAVVGMRYYKQSQLLKKEQLASYFASAQNAFSEISSNEDAEQIKKNKVILEEQFKAIGDSLTKPAFLKLENIYKAQVAIKENNLAEAAKLLETYKLNPEASEASAFMGELAALNLARVLIAQDKLAEARSKLTSIANEALFLNTEAIIVLAEISESQENKEQVSKLAEKVSRSRPEFSTVITQELKNRGYKIEE